MEKKIEKAHTGMKRNQDVKVNILIWYLIVKFNILIDINIIIIFIFKYFFLTRMPVGFLCYLLF